MQQKKLNALSLSGLMIGPILGSGIIILPPLIYSVAGSWALPAWILMIIVSFFFAFIFGYLSILYPGDAGISNAVEAVFGSEIKKLTSFYLIGAVLFGPVAVILTAAKYINFLEFNTALLAIIILFGCTVLLMMQVASIGKISFVMSSLAAITLFVGGVVTLLFYTKPTIEMTTFSADEFGYSLLLLFWIMVGWEVVGNYSADVENPTKTIPRAVTFSAIAIALVGLTVSAAVQMIDIPVEGTVNVVSIITGIFGIYSSTIMGILTFSLCVTTYLLFAGGVARLIAFLAKESYLPMFLAKKSKTNAPIYAIFVLTGVHFFVLLAVYFDFVNIEKLVALADGFFIGNALIGLFAAVKLLKNKILKYSAAILSCFFIIILMFSSLPILFIILSMAAVFIFRSLKYKRVFG